MLSAAPSMRPRNRAISSVAARTSNSGFWSITAPIARALQARRRSAGQVRAAISAIVLVPANRARSAPTPPRLRPRLYVVGAADRRIVASAPRRPCEGPPAPRTSPLSSARDEVTGRNSAPLRTSPEPRFPFAWCPRTLSRAGRSSRRRRPSRPRKRPNRSPATLPADAGRPDRRRPSGRCPGRSVASAITGSAR